MIEEIIIWDEDFALPDGTTVDGGDTPWSYVPPADGTVIVAEVQGGQFVYHAGASTYAAIVTPVIDISDVDRISATVTATGDNLELDNGARLAVSLDGAAPVAVSSFTGPGSTQGSLVIGPASTVSLHVQLSADSSSLNEIVRVSSVTLIGYRAVAAARPRDIFRSRIFGGGR